MASFDIVSELNKVELRNAVEQANKEISTRFDFKGSDARVEQADTELTLFGDNLNDESDAVVGNPFDGPDASVRVRPRTIGLQIEYSF